MSDFKWIELEDATYLAVFYDKYDGEKYSHLMDRVNINTEEVVTFEVPAEVYGGTDGCVRVGFLDEDMLLYISYDKPSPDMGGMYMFTSSLPRNSWI